MGDGTSGGHAGSGNPGNSASPLRIFTRVNSNGSVGSGEQTPDEASPRPRDATNALLSSAFSQPYDEAGEAAGRSAAGARPGTKAAPRVGRHGAHYHPLPSHWREHESGSSGFGSPVTPEGAGDDLAGVSRTVGPSGGASSQTLQSSALYGGSGEAPRSYHSPRDYYQAKGKVAGQSPIASPRLHIGTLREAFESASSLEWPNDRPGSSYSCQSTDQAGAGYLSEIQAESPLDMPAHGGRFPPALSSMAARPGGGRSALGAPMGGSRHHPTASTSSSHHSFGVSSPPLRTAGVSKAAAAPPASLALASTPPGMHGEDIVRKYLGLQQIQMQRQRQQHRMSSTPSATALQPQERPAPPCVLAGSTSPDDASAGSIVFRRAVSSGDLPTLDGPGHGALSSGSVADSRSFLTPDLVESPLEALVRRLTIELFQLYVNEDRKKTAEGAGGQAQQHSSATVKSNASSQFAEEDEFVLVGTSRVAAAAAAAAAPTATAAPGDGYIQQFRLGPSMRSGSNTPAVTMDGYFDPGAEASIVVETATAAGVATGAGAGTEAGDARPRPRHRLVQRTWMEEALIKARRVSTIDENAEEAILQGLDQLSLGDPAAARRPAAESNSSSGSNPPADEWAHVMSPRGFYRARDPAAPHRKLPAERRVRGSPAAGISPARASLIRAVGRRQSVRLQPGKGQIVVAETHAPGDAGRASERAKRANSLPGLMQVPETREVSYADLQRKAARAVVVERVRVVQAKKVAGGRRDLDQQLVSVELPPPVPLRVRRSPVRVVAEPLIIVRRAKAPGGGGGGGVSAGVAEQTPEARMQRVHNQLLGAQAVLSRHNSAMRKDAPHALKDALRVVMLDNAVEDRLGAPRDATAAGPRIAPPPWRSARRRSTLRKKDSNLKQSEGKDSSLKQSEGKDINLMTESDPKRNMRRRLLLHGPAYRIYSGIRARPDTYLFLFSDLLVVTTLTSGRADAALAMAPPSPDANIVPADSRFRVHIVIPLARSTTTLTTTREGASKRAGEDGDGEERRLERQEERIRRACLVFEKNPSEAVVYLINREIVEPVPDSVAGFLHRCTALSRRQIGGFLGAGILGENLHENPTPDEVEQEKLFHRQIWAAFLDRCSLQGVPLDEALRSVLFYVRLPNSPLSISVLLEIAALQWFAKNQAAPDAGVYVPDAQDVAVKLAFAIMTLNTELHNPLLRADAPPDAAFRELVLKFRASVVDDPAVAAKRKGNVLRKRDQPRVVTIMEVPADALRAIFDRVAANRLVTCSDARPAAAEFDVAWIRDLADAAHAAPLTDEQVEHEIEDVYCDPGFRDGALFNATSDRLPAKFSVDPPAWLRVTVRIPAPDAKLAISIRVLSVPAEPAAAAGDAAPVVAILPSSRLTFRAASAASFVIRPQQVGHFTLHFVSEGAHARYYHPIPSRTMVVEGLFMRQTLQLAWKRAEEQQPPTLKHQNHRARHMFGMDSQPTKSHWVRCIDAALRASADLPPRDALRSAERATQALDHQSSRGGGAAAAPSSSDQSDQGITCLQLLEALAST